MSISKKQDMLELFCSLLDEVDESSHTFNEFNRKLTDYFLKYGVQPKDNEELSNLLEYGGSVSNGNPSEKVYGFKIRNKHLYVKMIVDYLYSAEIPPEIQNTFLGISDKEWRASMLLISLILNAFTMYEKEG